LLNIIGGLDRADTGEVLVEGKNLVCPQGTGSSAAAAHWLNLQAFNLLPVLTALERRIYATPQGVSVEKRKKSGKAVLEIGLAGLGIAAPANSPVDNSWRVAVARAMVTEPALILADEPRRSRLGDRDRSAR
jgi:ABC-type lipoprotein export system ATPase subunit